MRQEIIENIMKQVIGDERLFGEGLINSWQDFASFQRAYEDDDLPWSAEEKDYLKILFHLCRSCKALEDVVSDFVLEKCV